LNKIVHVITGLANGGAEGVLYRLCKYDNNHVHVVISLTDEGKYASLLEKEGVQVHCLNLQLGISLLRRLWLLYRLIQKNRPNVLQTWMYHADLIGGVIAKFAGVEQIIWNVRHTTLETGKSKRSTILIAKLCARLSHWVPNKIIYCAHKAQSVHENLGYIKSKSCIISNGYDLRLYDHNTLYREKFRRELGVLKEEVLLGMVGRFDPQKDHFNLIAALDMVKKSGCEVKLALIGRGLDDKNQVLVDYIRSYNLTQEVFLLGQRTDIPSVMNGLDIHVLSSAFGEAFPNVLAEAMACGTPCVTTDVGDSPLIVGDSGWIVPGRNPEALSDAVIQAIREKHEYNQAWLNRKEVCRSRIASNFSIQKMVDSYYNAWFGNV
jgi:glycosyltransferase involved in cell wall biosynthesis